MSDSQWPDLSAGDLGPTLETLHLWSQIPGKVKLGCLPWLNESWQVPLYVANPTVPSRQPCATPSPNSPTGGAGEPR